MSIAEILIKRKATVKSLLFEEIDKIKEHPVNWSRKKREYIFI